MASRSSTPATAASRLRGELTTEQSGQLDDLLGRTEPVEPGAHQLCGGSRARPPTRRHRSSPPGPTPRRTAGRRRLRARRLGAPSPGPVSACSAKWSTRAATSSSGSGSSSMSSTSPSHSMSVAGRVVPITSGRDRGPARAHSSWRTSMVDGSNQCRSSATTTVGNSPAMANHQSPMASMVARRCSSVPPGAARVLRCRGDRPDGRSGPRPRAPLARARTRGVPAGRPSTAPSRSRSWRITCRIGWNALWLITGEP